MEGAIRGRSAEQGGANPCLGQQMSCLVKGTQDETPLSVVSTSAWTDWLVTPRLAQGVSFH